ncbi:MAG: phosphoglucomutase (alpha-D-glucose-1,6-bisphosphate-dependent) [Actinobacteria bacterium]|nr:phosphoglucomutase (alpha-D-glucose-1,6-bisphosphate-dependent) [Actinomycetota bacterium]
MSQHERAGQPATRDDLVDVDALIAAYHDRRPDVDDPAQQVAFGTSGHRGSSFDGSFNRDHILAISQAICEYRRDEQITGPLFVGRDTHALSTPAFDTCLEVFAANDVTVRIDDRDGYTPTPSLSRAILRHNADAGTESRADGVVITPSHNPPRDGGFKYNPPNGGPADASITGRIQDRANELLRDGVDGIARARDPRTHDGVDGYDFLGAYVDELAQVVDVDAIREAGVHIGVHPLGGASVAYWSEIADRHGLHLDLVDDTVDPTFGFMTLDSDGKIRMDCSSPHAMRSLIDLADRFDIAFGNDADADRHGIVTPDGLRNPNHYLAVAIGYLLEHRADWSPTTGIGKTLVSSSMIDAVVNEAGRSVVEVPVGFKWFVDGLLDGSLAFGGEESAGASFLQFDAGTWTTDKDGLALCLLAAEILAVTGVDPGVHYRRLTERHGAPVYRRIDTAATPREKARLKELAPEDLDAKELGGDEIQRMLTRAPGNDAPIGGLKVVTARGWFAARPSGTEDKNKIYAESFVGDDHLQQILDEAEQIVATATAE